MSPFVKCFFPLANNTSLFMFSSIFRFWLFTSAPEEKQCKLLESIRKLTCAPFTSPKILMTDALSSFTEVVMQRKIESEHLPSSSASLIVKSTLFALASSGLSFFLFGHSNVRWPCSPQRKHNPSLLALSMNSGSCCHATSLLSL